jgi:hypothetical protein
MRTQFCRKPRVRRKNFENRREQLKNGAENDRPTEPNAAPRGAGQIHPGARAGENFIPAGAFRRTISVRKSGAVSKIYAERGEVNRFWGNRSNSLP